MERPRMTPGRSNEPQEDHMDRQNGFSDRHNRCSDRQNGARGTTYRQNGLSDHHNQVFRRHANCVRLCVGQVQRVHRRTVHVGFRSDCNAIHCLNKKRNKKNQRWLLSSIWPSRLAGPSSKGTQLRSPTHVRQHWVCVSA